MDHLERFEKAAERLLDSARLTLALAAAPLALLMAGVARMTGEESCLFKVVVTFSGCSLLVAAFFGAASLYLARIVVAQELLGEVKDGEPGHLVKNLLEKRGRVSEAEYVAWVEKTHLAHMLCLGSGWLLLFLAAVGYIWS